MRGRLVILLGMLCASLSASGSAYSTNDTNSLSRPLVFLDDFTSEQLDRQKWSTELPWGRVNTRNGEVQYYADDVFEHKDGILRIKAEKRNMAGFNYTSGLLTTYNSMVQTYGYFEIRAKVPRGAGFWPAFWLMPVDRTWPPEIDVFEHLGREPGAVYFSNHWRDQTGKPRSMTTYYNDIDFSSEFHTFAIDWRPSEIIWYVDGVERARTQEGVPAQPMYAIVNLAIGGKWPGPPSDTTLFPNYLEVDYVRIFDNGFSTPMFLPMIQTRSATPYGSRVATSAEPAVPSALGADWASGTDQ